MVKICKSVSLQCIVRSSCGWQIASRGLIQPLRRIHLCSWVFTVHQSLQRLTRFPLSYSWSLEFQNYFSGLQRHILLIVCCRGLGSTLSLLRWHRGRLVLPENLWTKFSFVYMDEKVDYKYRLRTMTSQYRCLFKDGYFYRYGLLPSI